MDKFSIYKIRTKETIREAFKKHDANGEDFILVVDEKDKMIGIVTTGDFRKVIWASSSLEDPVEMIMNRNFVSLKEGDDHRARSQEIFGNTKIRQIPVLKQGKVIDIIFKQQEKGFSLRTTQRQKLHIPVVIMAGGFGTRLDPFTRILPKPLIPIGDKPIIEIIIEQFLKNGVDNFYISLNHKARMVKAFFEETKRSDFKISFIEEDEPLGTAGSLRFLVGKISTDFIVTNCDTLIEGDYRLLHQFHAAEKNILTIVASMQRHIIPYGVCTTSKNGSLKELNEKPQYDFLVNTGMYLLSPEALQYIPKKKFDITDLIKLLKKKKQRVGVYPISEKSWVDVGQWEEYKQALQKLSLLK